MGVGLWGYQQHIKRQEKKLIKDQEAWHKRQEKFSMDQKILIANYADQVGKALSSYKLEQEYLKMAETKLKVACKQDKKCFEDYEKEKIRITDAYQNEL